jgi:O-antigen biosynthesis protein
MHGSEPSPATEAADARARRIKVANESLGAAQRRAFWPDLAGAGDPGRPGLRMVARRFGAVARELSVPRGPVRGEGPPPARHIAARVEHHPYASWAAVRRNGAAALEPLPDGRESATPLHVAVVIPPFGFGSGGHEVVFRLTEQLEALGHTVSLWIDDPFRATRTSSSVLLRRIEDDFGVRLRAPLHLGLGDWFGADVAVATGSQTVWPLLGLPGVHARAYLVNDDEPAFYPRSVESDLAAETYRQDLYCITGTRWMFELLQERDGARGGWFDYPVAPAYSVRPVERRDDTVVVYARIFTHRRAVPLAVLALEELIVNRGRRVRVQMFGGEAALPDAPFDFEFLGLVRPERLAWTYSEATVGIALSMTNASLVPQDMTACGLPCVELAGGAAEATYGEHGGVAFAAFDPIAIADQVERLLDDPTERQRRRDEGLASTSARSWARSGKQVESHLRAALRERIGDS